MGQHERRAPELGVSLRGAPGDRSILAPFDGPVRDTTMSDPTRQPSTRVRLHARLDALTARLDQLERILPALPARGASPDAEHALAKCSLELSAARDAADRATRQRLELFGLLNRDIRTPLAGLLGTVGLLRRHPLDELSAEYAANIEACGNEVLDLLNQALALSSLPPEALDAEVAARRTARLGPALPDADVEHRGARPAVGITEPQPRPRVLVVEDNVINQRVAQKLLERVGVDVELAPNGLDALAMLDRTRYDLVLMDCEMPVLDGYTATRDLRRNERARGLGHTPVIALTASCLPEERLKCFESGMDDFLAKPASTELLMKKLREWLPERMAGAAPAA